MSEWVSVGALLLYTPQPSAPIPSLTHSTFLSAQKREHITYIHSYARVRIGHALLLWALLPYRIAAAVVNASRLLAESAPVHRHIERPTGEICRRCLFLSFCPSACPLLFAARFFASFRSVRFLVCWLFAARACSFVSAGGGNGEFPTFTRATGSLCFVLGCFKFDW